MNYTQSNAFATHAGTGHRMHQDTAPITTQQTADDWNQILWSLMKVQEVGGVAATTFDANVPASYSGLLAAINTLIGNAGLSAGAISLTATGYYTLPGGFIVQWGIGTDSGAEPTTTFAAPFPNACFGVLASHVGTTGGSLVEAVSIIQPYVTGTGGITGYKSRNQNGSLVNHFFIAFGK